MPAEESSSDSDEAKWHRSVAMDSRTNEGVDVAKGILVKISPSRGRLCPRCRSYRRVSTSAPLCPRCTHAIGSSAEAEHAHVE